VGDVGEPGRTGDFGRRFSLSARIRRGRAVCAWSRQRGVAQSRPRFV